MKSWITKNGTQIFRVLEGRSNSYLVVNNNHIILVDTGKKPAYQKLVDNIQNAGFNIKTIEYLILTHTHFDHCQSAYQIKQASGCKIVISENAKEFVSDGYTKLPDGTIFLTRSISRLGSKFGKKHFGYHSFQPDILIQTNTYYQIEPFDISVFHSQGHSEDSVSIIINDEIAVVGDVMFGVIKNAVFPPYADDVETMIKSWQKLLDTNCRLFLPGHGNAVTYQLLEKEYKKYIKAGKIE